MDRELRSTLTVLALSATVQAADIEDVTAQLTQGHCVTGRADGADLLAENRQFPSRLLARLGRGLRRCRDVDLAETALDRSVATARRTPEGDDDLANARRERCRLELELGRLDVAARDCASAYEFYQQFGPPSSALAAALGLAGVLRETGDLADSIRLYSDAVEAARAGGWVAQHRVALLGLAAAVIQVGDAGWATALSREARELCRLDDQACQRYCAAYEAPFIAMAGRHTEARELAIRTLGGVDPLGSLGRQLRLTVALTWLRQGQPGRTLEIVARLLEDLGEASSTVLVDEAFFIAAEAHLERKEYDAAAIALARGAEAAAGVGLREARGWPLEARLALGVGDEVKAAERLERYLAFMESERRSLDIGLMTYWSSDRVSEMEALLGLYLRQDPRRAAVHIGHTKAVAYTQQLIIDRGVPSVGGAESAGVNERRAYLEEAARLQPRPADPAELATLRASLPPDLGVLDIYLLPDEVALFYIARDEFRAARVPTSRSEVVRRADRLLRAVQRGADDGHGDAEWLAAQLLEPLGEVLLGGRPHLAVVPHLILHRLPFVLLPLEGRLLLEHVSVFTAPSLDGLAATTEDAPEPVWGNALVVADASGDLPGARGDVDVLRATFDDLTVLTGPEMTQEPVVRDALERADVIHLALHGFQGRRRRSGWLSLSPGAAADGRLESAELQTMSLRANFVALMSCETALGEPTAGDEMLGALDRGFLAAGARSVVSTRWRVDDHSAAIFSRLLYEGLRDGLPRVEAVAGAQRAMLRADIVESPHAGRTRGVQLAPSAIPLSHPFHWAPYVLGGDYR